MDIYDVEAVRAVWQRVHAAPPSEREYLAALIAEECGAYRAYCALLPHGGCFSAALRTLANEERHHVFALRALYYLLFGQDPPAVQPKCSRRTSFAEALRTRYAAELADVGTYRQAAERFPAQETLFLRLVREEQCHAQRILSIMTRLVGH